jgi:hypothetical protein
MLEVIRRRTFQDTDLSAVQESVARAVESDPEPFIAQYINNPLSHNGRYINADLFKETFSQYRESEETRNKFNGAVHNSAAVLSAELFRRVVADTRDLRRNTAIFLTGIPGAGKTTSVFKGEGLAPHFQLIFEGQMAKPESAIPKIQQALDARLKPVILAVHATPENALENTIKRFNHIGRGASIAIMSEIQGNLPDGLEAIRQRFGDLVSLEIIDVRNRAKTRNLSGWDNVNTLRSEGSVNEITQKLKYKLEQLRENGDLSEAAYRQALGNYYRPNKAVDSEGVKEHRADGYGRGIPERNRVEDFLNLAPKDALKHHPELDNAYQVLALVESQAKRDGHPSATVTAIVNQAKIGLAENLKKGVVPSVKKQAHFIDKSGGERER